MNTRTSGRWCEECDSFITVHNPFVPSPSHAPACSLYAPDFRVLAADWHGGQSSAMYAYASTGTIVDGLIREIDECVDARRRTRFDTYPLTAESDLIRLLTFREHVCRTLGRCAFEDDECFGDVARGTCFRHAED